MLNTGGILRQFKCSDCEYTISGAPRCVSAKIKIHMRKHKKQDEPIARAKVKTVSRGIASSNKEVKNFSEMMEILS